MAIKILNDGNTIDENYIKDILQEDETTTKNIENTIDANISNSFVD
jgi:hypothetical protein